MRRSVILIFSSFLLLLCFLGSFMSPAEERPHPYSFQYSDNYNPPKIPGDNPLTEEGVWLGRLLFYDPIISVNSKISCGNCHQQKLFFTDGLPRAIGARGDTLKRGTMGLVNLAWEKHFFRDGRDTSIEQVVKDHINNPKEMGAVGEAILIRRLKEHEHYPELFKRAFPQDPISMITVSKAIAQFTRTIVLNFTNGPEEYKNKGQNNRNWEAEESHAGSVARVGLMQCKYCHGKAAGGQQNAVYINDSVYKAPTLVNIKYTGPYMHDGRFKTLKEVFEFYNANLENIKAKNPGLMGGVNSASSFTQYDLDHADEIFSGNSDASITSEARFSNPFVSPGFNWHSSN